MNRHERDVTTAEGCLGPPGAERGRRDPVLEPLPRECGPVGAWVSGFRPPDLLEDKSLLFEVPKLVGLCCSHSRVLI